MKTLNDNLLYKLTKPALIKTIKELYDELEQANATIDTNIEAISKINGDNQNLFGENNVLKIREMNLQQRIDKAIEKLYCWGEALDSEFQKEMLDILKGKKD